MTVTDFMAICRVTAMIARGVIPKVHRGLRHFKGTWMILGFMLVEQQPLSRVGNEGKQLGVRWESGGRQNCWEGVWLRVGAQASVYGNGLKVTPTLGASWRSLGPLSIFKKNKYG